MKTQLTRVQHSLSAGLPPLASHAVRAARSRLLGNEGALTVDGLETAVRSFSVATVVVLSLWGYGRGERGSSVDVVDPVLVAVGLVVYNLLVTAVLGVPWRRSPGFPLFMFDWAVATTAVVLTGGFFSPFILLYYALVIGAALRIGFSRSLLLVCACTLVYIALSLAQPADVPGIRLPVLVVQVTSLVMVVVTAVGMKRVVEVEARRVQLEEQSVRQIKLLNGLTNTVLSASPDVERVMRTVAAVSSQAVEANSGMAVLFNRGPLSASCVAEDGELDNVLVIADRDPNPVTLSQAERQLLADVVRSGAPVLAEGHERGASQPDLGLGCPGLDRPGAPACSVACVPFLLHGGVIGALFVGRQVHRNFGKADLNLLTAIGQQMAVAVRLARLYEMEREKAVRSEERERLERDLLSMVSHELRTPLTSIKTCVGALTRQTETLAGSATSTEERLLNNISRSTDRLINLVNELLDMARLRAGRVSLDLQKLNLGEVIGDIAAQVRPLMDARCQLIRLDLPSTGSPRWERLVVSADRKRIEQVLLNLLSNANKYAPEGSEITVGATPRYGRARVFVRDHGPGLHVADRERVFDKFYQGATSAPVTDSSGLGLAIARSIVELHGGHIDVESKLGQGSTFFFTLPHEQEASAGARTQAGSGVTA